MIRLFVPDPLKQDLAVALATDQTHYLRSVMRREVGNEVLLFNGRDGEWRSELLEAGKRACIVAPREQMRPQGFGPDLDLVVALVKRGRLETIVEKAAELGARRVRLTITRHTNADHAKIERLRAIAIEAAEQTGRLDVPEVAEPVKLDKLLDSWDAGRTLIFCDEGGEAKPALEALKTPLAQSAVLIGPEGGFSPEERERLRGLAFVIPISLGPRILRADTAAISALTLVQAAVGDWR